MVKSYEYLIFRPALLTVLGVACILNCGFSQTKEANDKWAKLFQLQQQTFIDDRTDIPFPNLDTLKTLNNAQFYFGSIDKPTMVYIGFEGCTPCRFELPLLIKTANDKKYKGYSFVYMTYDDSATICDELKGQKTEELVRLKIMIIPQTLIHDDKLVMGYPTKYFINSKGIIKSIQTGGRTSDNDRVLNKWYEMLDALK